MFEETVEKDICFGPLNFNYSETEAKKRAYEMLELVGLSKEVMQKSPFALSGGQMRRVAIAGVLASEPKVVVLDEPTASLDPIGRKEMMELFTNYQREHQATIVLVTHQMDEVVAYAKRVLVMDQGEIVLDGTPKDIFSQSHTLQQLGLDIPPVLQLAEKVKNRFDLNDWPALFDEEELAEQIVSWIRSRRGT